MSFISYAQNFEDVLLWRALKHIEKGFYIDVGAHDPHHDSVTKAFYERGWRGINIEPVSQWFEKITSERLRDINLQVAAGNQTGELLIYEFTDTGWSTLCSEIAEKHELESGCQRIERTVLVKTLTEICIDFHLSPIHFLKIDVEGAEKQVLEGVDFSIIRPWIVLVESTIPNSQIEDYEGWESILLNANYEFVYFDGLNRFYVAQEHAELKESFRIPPNVFDGFVLSGDSSAPFCNYVLSQKQQLAIELLNAKADVERLTQQFDEGRQLISQINNQLIEAKQKLKERENLERELRAALAKINELNQLTHHWWTVADGLNKELQGVYNSKSWRITLPLRLGMKCLKLFFTQPKQLAKHVLGQLIRFVLERPVLKAQALRFLNKRPDLKARLKRINIEREPVESLTPESVNYFHLTARANRIYQKLNIEIDKREKREGN